MTFIPVSQPPPPYNPMAYNPMAGVPLAVAGPVVVPPAAVPAPGIIPVAIAVPVPSLSIRGDGGNARVVGGVLRSNYRQDMVINTFVIGLLLGGAIVLGTLSLSFLASQLLTRSAAFAVCSTYALIAAIIVKITMEKLINSAVAA